MVVGTKNAGKTLEGYTGPERRSEAHLTDEQLEQIAEKAATKAVKKMTDEAFKAVGKTVVTKLFWIVGVVTVALFAWLQASGKVPPKL
jgi:3-methyladenine DNA glycosylase Tag